MKNAPDDTLKHAVNFKLYPLGDAALVVAFENIISPKILEQVLWLAERIKQSPLAGLKEWVTAYNSLTLFYDPWILSKRGKCDPDDVIRSYVSALLQQQTGLSLPPSRLLEIPLCYDEKFGPDLEFVARHNKLTRQEVIYLHSHAEYLVYMLGFAPGFPYLGGMPKRLSTPRRQSPRNKIPAGSVGIAAAQTGIYPLETPGGWQIIGRTPLRLFDPQQQPPTLLQAGDRLTFKPISRQEYLELSGGAADES